MIHIHVCTFFVIYYMERIMKTKSPLGAPRWGWAPVKSNKIKGGGQGLHHVDVRG